MASPLMVGIIIPQCLLNHAWGIDLCLSWLVGNYPITFPSPLVISPFLTFDTSKCGSQRTNPRPIMSMAALLKALLAVGVDRKWFTFEPETEVGVATALESVLLLLRWELVSTPEVEWDPFFGLVVKTRYIKAFAVSLVQLTPKASSTFWPSFSASRSNKAPITPEKNHRCM